MRDQTNFFLFLGIYAIITFLVFHLVYRTSKQVIDEEFHLRQGEHYCHGRFHVWDDKITTFPGLYLISASFLSPFKACSVYFLRMTSLVASVANAYFIYIIRKLVIVNQSDTYLLLETMSLAILPPLYFFSHLYYTDVLSVTMVLMMIYFSLREMHNWGAIAGFLAILMRQTNVVWVGFVYGSKLVDMTMEFCAAHGGRTNRRRQTLGYKDLISTVTTLLDQPSIILGVLAHAHSFMKGYELNLLGFVAFLWHNGSIVVGDKTAHEAAIHLPQLFYFALFFAAFSSSHVLSASRRVFRFVMKRWYVTCFFIGFCTSVVYVNTIVHPYLLADNRHYTFYIWMRFFERWWVARFLPVPLYYGILVLLGLILFTTSSTSKQTVGFSLLWVAATVASVALQQLIEVRYFILPFLILRLLQTNILSTPKWLVLEVALNLVINVLTIYIFCTKSFYWIDYNEPQHIIW